MMDWLDGLAGPEYTRAILWTFAALVLLVIVLVIIRLIRGLTFGTFVAGGRNRKTRLAVMDATAVDSHRRLILVRRDDIEHLLLIGGPTDVVVERDIRLTQSRRAEMTADAARHAHGPQQQAIPQPQPPKPRPPVEAAPIRPVPPRAAEPQLRPAPAPSAPPAPRVEPARPAPVPLRSEPPMQRQAPALRVAPPVQRDDLDDALLKELEVSLDENQPRQQPARPNVSLDDEMTKLLGELSSHKR